MDDYNSLKTNRPCKQCGDVRIIVADGLCNKCYYEPIYGNKNNKGKVMVNETTLFENKASLDEPELQTNSIATFPFPNTSKGNTIAFFSSGLE